MRRTPDERRLVIFKRIKEERARQDAQWGGGRHDGEHNLHDWCDYISKQVYKLRARPTSDEAMERLIKIAALAIAALEAAAPAREEPADGK